MEYNYTAIAIRKKEIGETDRLYTFYTLEAGKIQAIGKGARKPKAKLAGHLETLNRLDLIVARRHGLGNIASAVAEEYAMHLKADEASLRVVLGAMGQFERLVGLEERDRELFALLQQYLELADHLAQGGQVVDRVRMVTIGFLFQVLAHLGYRADLRRCAVSGERLEIGKRYCFAPSLGGVVAMEHAREVRLAIPVSVNAIKLIRMFLQNRLSSLVKLWADEDTLRQADRVLQSFLAWILQ